MKEKENRKKLHFKRMEKLRNFSHFFFKFSSFYALVFSWEIHLGGFFCRWVDWPEESCDDWTGDKKVFGTRIFQDFYHDYWKFNKIYENWKLNNF